MPSLPARLCLADGTVFEGSIEGVTADFSANFSADSSASEVTVGEVVFTTGMTGYQEVLSDPSYAGQIVVMTAPQIGNTGTNADDPESRDGRPHVRGFVMREHSPVTSSHRAESSLAAYLGASRIPLLTDIDTRRLTRHLRDHGSQNGAIGTLDPDTLVDHARTAPNMEGLDLASGVSCSEAYTFSRATPEPFRTLRRAHAAGAHVVAIDLGLKQNILRCFVDLGCKVTVVPASSSAADVLAHQPDGIFISNGPGDPAAITKTIATIRELLGQKPLFGICLGHQLLSLAVGASTYKLKFGHRGLNQPVQDLDTGKVEITSQNHGFAVDLATLPANARQTHRHLNDGTSEGLAVPSERAFSVQFHPEAAAGPHDTLHLFSRFMKEIEAS